MGILVGNSLSSSFEHYRKREIRRLVEEIPKERRAEVLERIQAQRLFGEGGDVELGRLALKYLKEGGK